MVSMLRRYIHLEEPSESGERMTLVEKAYGPYYSVVKKIAVDLIDSTDHDSEFDRTPSPTDVMKNFLNHSFSLAYKSNYRVDKYKEFSALMAKLPDVNEVVSALKKAKEHKKQVTALGRHLILTAFSI